ncbi:acyl-CoA hydrolase [Paucilactobacillus hokkaidonensis JCM 18461]|uniref:Acyl-CoA hydrolase n=2 Tax=Paucilactobacillus hokkaidonensis TaxID=1193095 RepID=A0A0A1GTF9_9LACO|nr:hotdog domain-containing protein [Paucilactobacillus hokkaidonensis]KRO09310.1 acyl-CoA hydrolase [Paucilactobacillus hokkaidonensis]BAP85275.1 acyl-CoA hydrolase [Paucilactobacillus hokkaidonensis JCM 18461]
MPTITCNDTLAVACHRIFPTDLNEHGTLFGGRVLDLVDREASIAAMRIARQTVVTATIDHVNFIAPFKAQDSMCLEAYVTGFGNRSIEVFAKVTGEHLKTGKRFLGFTCFITFVIDDVTAEVTFDHIAPETKEQQTMCANYSERVAQRKQLRLASQTAIDNINIEFPWSKF